MKWSAIFYTHANFKGHKRNMETPVLYLHSDIFTDDAEDAEALRLHNYQ